MTKTIAIIGALDTKGREFAFVRDQIEARGFDTLVINTGIMGEPHFEPDVPAADVAEAGGTTLAALREKADRGLAIDVMTAGVGPIVADLHEQGRIDAVLGMGGSAGTVIATAGMRALPLGVPKVMVSTLAAGDTAAYVGTRDIVLIPSVVDVSGINRISAQIYSNAVGAVIGMLENALPDIPERPLLAATMFGNTTELVDRVRTLLENKGYEVLVFHATGTGGRTMEALIAEGYFDGVLDLTTTEWADELTGGVLTAGPTRMEAAAVAGLPQIIVPGCLDMANFWAPDTVPPKYDNRLFYKWNPNVTLMRTTVEENRELGRILAEKANAATGPVVFFLPLKGVSILDSPGNEFWNPEADRALFDAIKEHVREDIPVLEMDHNVNDEEFADAIVERMLALLESE